MAHSRLLPPASSTSRSQDLSWRAEGEAGGCLRQSISSRKNHKPHKEEKPREANTLDNKNRIHIGAEGLGQELDVD